MKNTIFSALLIIGLISAPIGISRAGTDMHGAPPASSKDFDQLKALSGHWVGTSNHPEEGEVTVDFHPTAGGSALVETLFPGTPHEMVSVYHDVSGKLAMTHYCMLGNQPNMTLKKSNPKEMDFDFSKTDGLNAGKDMHMHSLAITMTDADNIVERWSLWENGKETQATTLKLARAK